MIIGYASDGEVINRELLDSNGFVLHENDFRKNYDFDRNEEVVLENFNYVFNFVGFLINKNSDLYLVFPKNFKVKNEYNDSKLLFTTISNHIQKKPILYFGDEFDKRFISNYPFSSFFGIYDYFVKYGLHIVNHKSISENDGIKINWKETIRSSKKIVARNKINLFPIKYSKNTYHSTFLTECMIFSINYTIEKFESFINYEKVERCSEIYSFEHKESVIEKLLTIRQQTFRDIELNLVDHLISFFQEVNIGGNYYLKHYAFSSIWEDMVMEYLKYHFKEVSDNKVVFGSKRDEKVSFIKKSFNPNLENTSHHFIPDYYYTHNDKQYIFDAKYYSNIAGIDYKQIAYYLFLCEFRDDVDMPKKFSETYSALILPSNKRESKVHFKMSPRYNTTFKNLVILEEYLNIRDIMDFYNSI